MNINDFIRCIMADILHEIRCVDFDIVAEARWQDDGGMSA